MNLTSQQLDFVKTITTTGDNVALVARAGCGKTSTILAAVDAYSRVFPMGEITICAFGKAIQKEIEGKLKARGLDDWRKYQASTTHSMGFGLVKYVFRPEIDDKKVWKLIDARNGSVFQEYGAQIKELVHLAKTDGFGFFGDVQIGDVSAWYRLADHYGVNSLDDTSQMDALIEAAQLIYRASLEQTDVVDFDDMILFPLIKNLRVRFQRDLIFLDEAQDTSRARRALVKKFVKPDGRIVVVGDDRQAIMGFAGASANALDEFIAELNAVILPLNVTWRCPKAVVTEAQKLVPDIQAADSAIDGEVVRTDALPEVFASTDAILCRNTAPLIETAYALIRKGVACKVEGREIGTGLIKLIERWKRITTITAFLDRLEDFRVREVQKAQAKGLDNKIDEINDRCETLVVICQACQQKNLHTVADAKDFIQDLFADDVQGVVTLCTYHRSKGREWPHVMLVQHSTRCPSPRAKQAWQLRQEANLAYVAVTRAQQKLTFVG